MQLLKDYKILIIKRTFLFLIVFSTLYFSANSLDDLYTSNALSLLGLQAMQGKDTDMDS